MRTILLKAILLLSFNLVLSLDLFCASEIKIWGTGYDLILSNSRIVQIEKAYFEYKYYTSVDYHIFFSKTEAGGEIWIVRKPKYLNDAGVSILPNYKFDFNITWFLYHAIKDVPFAYLDATKVCSVIVGKKSVQLLDNHNREISMKHRDFNSPNEAILAVLGFNVELPEKFVYNFQYQEERQVSDENQTTNIEIELSKLVQMNILVARTPLEKEKRNKILRDEVLPIYLGYIKKSPNDVGAWLLLSYVYLKLGDSTRLGQCLAYYDRYSLSKNELYPHLKRILEQKLVEI